MTEGNEAGVLDEPLVWESTTPAYIRFVTHRRYLKFRPYARKWYRPICPNCARRTQPPPLSDEGD